MTTDIASVIETVRRLSAAEPRAYYGNAVVRSQVFEPVPFDVPGLEHSIDGKLPPDLLELYRVTGGMALFKDVDGALYGLEVPSPRDVLALTEEAGTSVHQDMVRGDLMFARMYGVGDYFVIRCDPSQNDFGQILFLEPIDPREYWIKIADSLSEFLSRLVENRGHPYWPGFGDPGPRQA